MGRLKKLRSPVLPFDVFASELNIKKSKGKISLFKVEIQSMG